MISFLVNSYTTRGAVKKQQQKTVFADIVQITRFQILSNLIDVTLVSFFLSFILICKVMYSVCPISARLSVTGIFIDRQTGIFIDRQTFQS